LTGGEPSEEAEQTVILQVNQSAPSSIITRLKNIFGVGLYLLLMGIVIEALAVLVRQWVSFPVTLNFVIQIALTVICVAICLSGVIWFNRSLNLVKINFLNAEKKVVTYGPFAYVRHPLYAALILSLPPLFIIWFEDLLFFIPWIFIFFISHFIVTIEERGLVKEFGEQYKNYRKQVPSLFPYKGAAGKRYHDEN
jgi:protein-S-isoprenylcysteine O-methyltransferase Ste14